MEVMRRLALEEPPRLDAAMPAIPRPLVDLHARLVARDPAKRPQTAREVARELREFASSRSAPDTRSVRSLMARLFGAEAERKRELLTQALERAAPAGVAALRQTLESSAGLEPATSTEGVIVRGPPSEPSLVISTRGTRKKRLRAVAAVALLAAGVAGVAMTAGAMRHGRSAQGGGSAAPMAATATAMPNATISAMPATTTSAVPIAVAAATAKTPTKGAPPPTTTKTAPAARSRPRAADTRSTSSRLPNVDPTPF
jgi:hypothetical protein